MPQDNYTLVNIEQLPQGAIQPNSKIMFGISEILHTATAQDLLNLLGVNTDPVNVRFIKVPLTLQNNFEEQYAWNEILAVQISINTTVTSPIIVEQGQILVFEIERVFGFGAEFGVSKKLYAWAGGSNIFTSITNGAEELIPLGESKLNLGNPNVNTIELGNIGTQNVWDAFNADSNAPFFMTADSFIKAETNEGIKVWSWVGSEGFYGGTSTQAQESDFVLLSEGTPETGEGSNQINRVVDVDLVDDLGLETDASDSEINDALKQYKTDNNLPDTVDILGVEYEINYIFRVNADVEEGTETPTTNGGAKKYSAQFAKTFDTPISIQHFGNILQRSYNILDALTNDDKTIASDDDYPIEIQTNENGNFFYFPEAFEKRLDVNIECSFTLESPPFDKGFQLHIRRGEQPMLDDGNANGAVVDDRSRSAQIRNFSLINPGQVSFGMYTFAQGLNDPYYQSPNGGFGLLVENVTSSNSYLIKKVKLDITFIKQQ